MLKSLSQLPLHKQKELLRDQWKSGEITTRQFRDKLLRLFGRCSHAGKSGACDCCR